MSGMQKRFYLRKTEVLFRMRSHQPGKGVEMRPMRKILPGHTAAANRLRIPSGSKPRSRPPYALFLPQNRQNILRGWDKWSLNLCELEGIATIVLPPLGIIGIHGAYLFSTAKNPHKKIYWTPYRKFVLGMFCGYCGLVGIVLFCLNMAALYYGNWSSLLYGLPMSYLHIRGAVTGWNLFNQRAEEDVDYEEDSARARLNVFRSLANGFGLGALLFAYVGIFMRSEGLLPLSASAGILFLLLAVISLILYIRKGGTNYRAAIIFCILGIAVQAVSFIPFILRAILRALI